MPIKRQKKNYQAKKTKEQETEERRKNTPFNSITSHQYSSPISEIEEKMLAKLLQDDTILPCQLPYLASLAGCGQLPLHGWKGLLAYAFLMGIHEAQLSHTSKQTLKIKKEAIEWINSNEGTCSFQWYCDLLHIDDSTAARQAILAEA